MCAYTKAWPLPYYAQEKAWVDGVVFAAWLHDVLLPAADALPYAEILLVVDNAPGHLAEIDAGKVHVRFMPPIAQAGDNLVTWG